MADVEVVAHPLAVVLDLGQQAVLSRVQLALQPALNVLHLPPLGLLLVYLQVDLQVHVHIYLQVLLLRHHLAQLFVLDLLWKLIHLQSLKVGMRFLLGKGSQLLIFG